uniref:NADH dehydrogenase subunit 5 n=1 Tax=Timomenus komarovi TaxID=1301248 RepID=UPI0030FE1B69|nr:NADH dehydrogenase subunit 5 [Timomenus komarovi]
MGMGFNKVGTMWGFLFLGVSGLGVVHTLVSLWQDTSIGIEWEILHFNSTSVIMFVFLDWMAWSFLSTVMFISGCVLIYSDEYMKGDKFLHRFVGLVVLFVISMLFLIVSPNLLSMLLGWDGLGLVSYCLVVYYQSAKSYNAGMLTALTNRVGDVMLLMSAAWWLSSGGWNYIFYAFGEGVPLNPHLSVVGVLILVAAMTKSAQIPFSAWLPAAMAAPTPVSSLVHSSTLVTAGVYLMIRFHGALGINVNRSLILLAGLTMLLAGLGANLEMDLKKIIALSTLSQLGLMMTILGMGFPVLAFFHLITHALFKALLFMCAGVYIHVMGNNQDVRWMGGVGQHMPMTSACFVLANLALCGCPFLAGFYSKDAILDTALVEPLNTTGLFLFFVATGLTAGYSTRLVAMALTSNYKGKPLMNWGDSNWGMLIPMGLMAGMAVMGGSLLAWGTTPTPPIVILPLPLKGLTMGVVLGGSLFGVLVGSWFFNPNRPTWLGSGWSSIGLKTFAGDMWFLPKVSSVGLIRLPLGLGNLYFFSLDQGWSEKSGGQGLYEGITQVAKVNEQFQGISLKVLLGFVGLGFWMYLLLLL